MSEGAACIISRHPFPNLSPEIKNIYPIGESVYNEFGRMTT